VRVPVTHFLELSGAGRYDHFAFAGNGIGKFTYNAGAELRPMRSLLLRASYGTGFRAPDLHYVFTGPGNTHPSATDYYLCRTEEPDEAIGDCSYADEGIVTQRSGNRRLKPETSKSLDLGIVWAPSRRFDVSVSYFRVSMANQVQDLSTDQLLRDEADCRIGQTTSGKAVDVNSPTCLDAIARVQRFTSGVRAGELDAVAVNPINIAHEKTTGIDVAVHGNLPTSFGTFSLSLAHTHVFDHTFRQYPGDPTINKLAFDSGYDIPRDKSTASLTWSIQKLKWTVEGRRLGKLPNYDQDAFIKASYLFNTTLQYDFTDHLRGSLSVVNLFDTNPVRDPTYASYPYYDISWFDSTGRSAFSSLPGRSAARGSDGIHPGDAARTSVRAAFSRQLSAGNRSATPTIAVAQQPAIHRQAIGIRSCAIAPSTAPLSRPPHSAAQESQPVSLRPASHPASPCPSLTSAPVM
jgi:outer membrane receptor protein involved in Fe transport